MERFGFVFLVAGLGFFALAFAVSGWVPFIPFSDLKVMSVQELAKNVPPDFIELKEQYPQAFQKAFGQGPISQALAEALVIGRQQYIGEGCWHCHSQQVRPVGNDEARFGRVHFPEEFNNDLNYPALWGTRRVGPDLLRESGRHSNDWHVAHFWNPTDVAPLSIMPRYPWFFEADGTTPNKVGLSVIAYVQWLGSWIESHRETVYDIQAIEEAYPRPTIAASGPNEQPDSEASGTKNDKETDYDLQDDTAGDQEDDGYE